MMSDDDTDLLCRAFHVENKPKKEKTDPKVPPTSGQEYLRRVQAEAKKCPAVVVADLDTKSYLDKQTFKVSNVCGLHPAPHGFSPSVQWQRDHMARFSGIRQKFSRHKAQLKKNGKRRPKRLPEKTDVQGWCHLCFGQLRPSPLLSDRTSGLLQAEPSVDASFSASESNGSQSEEGVEGKDSGQAEEGGGSNGKGQIAEGGGSNGEGQMELREEGVRGNPPLLSIVSYMDQPTVIQVLEYHINWFEATGFTALQGQWFYALLTSLEKPLDPETCSLLRSLAKNCANLRATLSSPSDSRLAPLNLLICLVARYFDQSDLADKSR